MNDICFAQKERIMKFRIAAITLLLVACTTSRSDENVRLETARAIGGITSDQVTVTNLHVGMKTATWDADTPKGHYKCEADDMLKHPANCVKQ
jgi:hypothetical protein